MGNRIKLTPKRREKFLAALEETASVTGACKMCNLSRNMVYVVRKKDKEFAEEWESAVESGTDRLEDEAIRRAHDGCDEPVYYQGEEVGVIRKYSDTLLIFMLKARRPEKYREKFEHAVSGDLRVEIVSFKK